jgi:membrane-bound ClpP family serine protease
MSGGSLVALAADEIVLDAHATLGPVNPQLGQYAASILAAGFRRPRSVHQRRDQRPPWPLSRTLAAARATADGGPASRRKLEAL